MESIRHFKFSLVVIICLSISTPPRFVWAADAPPANPEPIQEQIEDDQTTEAGIQCTDEDCAKPASALDKIPVEKIERIDQSELIGRVEPASSGGSLFGNIDWGVVLGGAALVGAGLLFYKGFKDNQKYSTPSAPPPWYQQPAYPGPIYNRPPPYLPYQPYMGGGVGGAPAILPYAGAQPYAGQPYYPQPYTLTQPYNYTSGLYTQPSFLGGIPMGGGGSYTYPQYYQAPAVLPYYLPY